MGPPPSYYGRSDQDNLSDEDYAALGDERRRDYRPIVEELRRVSESLVKLEKRVAATEEVWTDIQSVSRVFKMVGAGATWLVKVGSVVAGIYAMYKFVILDIVKQVTGKGT